MCDKKKFFLIFLLAIILTVVTLRLHFKPEQYQNYYADKMSNDMTFYGPVDIEIKNDDTMEIVGDDPYIIYTTPKEDDYLSGKITFASTSEIPLHLHIYYADELSNFSEENTIDVTTDIASKDVVFMFPDENILINYVRIDFDNTLGSVPSISSVGLQNDTVFSRLESILLWLMDGHLLIMFAVSFVLAFALVYFFQHSGEAGYRRDLAAILIMTTCIFIMYYDYLLGEKVFTFYDEVGSDSFIQRYSGLISTVNRISDGLWKEYVDFTRGLGNRVQAFNWSIGNWFCIFGKAGIATWMGIDYYLLVLLAAVSAYYWAKLYSGNAEISLMIAFGYAMSSEFTIRSAWYMYPRLALGLIFWLLAFELQHRKGKWKLLPLATMVFFYSNDSYFCIFWGVLFVLYILFRTLTDSEGEVAGKSWLKVELLYGLFAVLGMLDRLIAQLSSILHSVRFTNAVSEYTNSFDSIFSNKAIVFSALLRTVGQTINGISEDFSGRWQFLSDPTFYCGILFFLLIPMAIYNLEKRKRILYMLIVIASFLYIMVIPIRIMANGFSGTDFRQSSYWISIIMLILSMEILEQIFWGNNLKERSLKIFLGTVVITVLLLLLAGKLKYIVRIEQLMLSILFIILYGIVMQYLLLQRDKRKWILRSLCVMFVVETLAVSWASINDRNAITKEDLCQKKYYNDYTVDALDMIDTIGEGGGAEWYRLDKSYGSVGLCDSLAQGYYGVSSYIGGIEADPGNIAIYQALELTRTNYGYHCLMGTGGNIYASSLLGVKYYLSRSEIVDWYGLEYLAKVGDIFIYKNKLALPIAYTYGQTVDEKEFDKLSIYDKSKNILDACVVSSQDNKVMSVTPSQFDFSDLSEHQVPYEQSGQFYNVDIDEGQVLIIRMSMSKSGYFQTLYYIDKNGAICGESITYGEGEKVVEVCCDNLASVCFSEDMCKDLSSVVFYAVDAEEYYAELKQDVVELQNNAMEIINHDDIYNYIEGAITCDGPEVLATSIPIRNEWKILIDGEEKEVITVNKAFVGCFLEAGKHDVVIYYDGKNWFEANVFRLFGFIISIVILAAGYIKNYKFMNIM